MMGERGWKVRAANEPITATNRTERKKKKEKPRRGERQPHPPRFSAMRGARRDASTVQPHLLLGETIDVVVMIIASLQPFCRSSSLPSHYSSSFPALPQRLRPPDHLPSPRPRPHQTGIEEHHTHNLQASKQPSNTSPLPPLAASPY